MKHTKVKDIMTTELKTIGKEQTVIDAVNVMAEHNISCVLVFDEGKPEGILTERDILRIVKDHSNTDEMKVHETMSSPVQTIHDTATIVAAGNLMQKHNIRRFPVVSEHGDVIGIITETDVLRGSIELTTSLAWKIIELDVNPDEFKKRFSF